MTAPDIPPGRRCGVPTRRGGRCRNPAGPTGRCSLHAGAALPLADPENGGPLPPADDPGGRLELLQDAAERRALEALRAGEEGDNGRLDASFARNARLAATLARTRLALSRARGKPRDGGAGSGGSKEGGTDEGAGAEETAEIALPDNERQ